MEKVKILKTSSYCRTKPCEHPKGITAIKTNMTNYQLRQIKLAGRTPRMANQYHVVTHTDSCLLFPTATSQLITDRLPCLKSLRNNS